MEAIQKNQPAEEDYYDEESGYCVSYDNEMDYMDRSERDWDECVCSIFQNAERVLLKSTFYSLVSCIYVYFMRVLSTVGLGGTFFVENTALLTLFCVFASLFNKKNIPLALKK